MRESKGLMGLTPPQIGYDGLIQIGNQQVQVNDGVLQLGPRRLSVDEDGQVTDEKSNPVAHVKNGMLIAGDRREEGFVSPRLPSGEPSGGQEWEEYMARVDADFKRRKKIEEAMKKMMQKEQIPNVDPGVAPSPIFTPPPPGVTGTRG